MMNHNFRRNNKIVKTDLKYGYISAKNLTS